MFDMLWAKADTDGSGTINLQEYKEFTSQLLGCPTQEELVAEF